MKNTLPGGFTISSKKIYNAVSDLSGVFRLHRRRGKAMKSTDVGAIKMVALAAIATVGVSAAESLPEQERVVDVCIHGRSPANAYSAQVVASKVFAEIGVRIEWHSRESCPSSASAIQISFSEQTKPTLKPRALAYALPYEGTDIVVFSDRVAQTAKNNQVPQLLAYVWVHEIAHILQNLSRHSATGIMKADWDSDEYFEMSKGRLRFTPDDIHLIYLGLDVRARNCVPLCTESPSAESASPRSANGAATYVARCTPCGCMAQRSASSR